MEVGSGVDYAAFAVLQADADAASPVGEKAGVFLCPTFGLVSGFEAMAQHACAGKDGVTAGSLADFDGGSGAHWRL